MKSPVIVILGAGRPFTGTGPSALIQPSGDRRVLDWILEAFEQSTDDPEFHFVGGYRMEAIVEEYPDIHFSKNDDWEESGTLSSLFAAPLPESRPVYVCYADTIFEPEAVGALRDDSGATIGVDKSWQTRYHSRTEESLDRAEKVRLEENELSDIGRTLEVDDADAEFTGLVRLSQSAVENAKDLWNTRTLSPDLDIPALIRALGVTDTTLTTADVNGDWAELETADDLSRFVLDTKANTLRRLQSMVEESVILQQYTFTVEDWEENSEDVCDDIERVFNKNSVIVRSSALAEDGWDESNAGRFESVLNVPTNDPPSLRDAIEYVIDSYPDESPGNQVLVQPMISNVDQSGVVMTRSLDVGGPYYIINYDATTTSTESVTDGSGEHIQTAIVRKDLAKYDSELELTVEDIEPDEGSFCQYPTGLDLEELVNAVQELETLIGHTSLDVEFVITEDGTVYVLQARPMTLDPAEKTTDDDELFHAVDTAREEFEETQASSPFILGDKTVYGVMPDWNPAEIIGRQPRQLASSLYRYLIMNETWAQQRAEYGYRDVRPQPLMKSFVGQPYVDVRADFNSFIPDSVPDDLAEDLVNYYLDTLEANPELHDKIEFEIAITCLTFDYEHQIQRFLDAGFTEEELQPFKEGLREITQEAVGRIDDDLEEIEELEDRYRKIVDGNASRIRTAYHLLDDCRRLGTLPFAHLARTAFVATSLLRSLERKGVLTSEQRSTFQNSLNTVARRFERDGYRVASGELEWDEFVDEYGHLRPGTYEITSPAYEESPEKYLRPIVDNATEPEDHSEPKEVWDADTKAEIETELDGIGLDLTADEFIKFLVDAIEGREYSKFLFSRNLSEALEMIGEFGEEHGFSREELSHVPIEEFFTLTLDPPTSDIESWLESRVHEGRSQHTMTRSVELPSLLFDEQDLLVFERSSREPNFVTENTVSGDVVEIDDDDVDPEDIDGKIVLIPQADPGFDWLFGHDIAGLVTMYGGSNSHMAVRAAEFSLPAAIGIGETRYEQLGRADVLELNCGAKTMDIIQ